jgi:rhodanese-related sulfurtransferase/rubrerythrin
MGQSAIVQLGPDALRALMEHRHEKDYLLIDVRQPDEYEAGHIPGALLYPLTDLEARLFSLPGNRELIFYCHSGGRSSAAAALTEAVGVTQRPIYNLVGGILAWNGALLPESPQVGILDKAQDVESLLYTAMDLEKGAWRFYRAVLERFAKAPWRECFATLATAETAHAKTVYAFWARQQKQPLPFEALFEQLSGELLEGGTSLTQALARLAEVDSDHCMRLMELALQIEYAAYDLYRAVAEKSAADAREALLSIAQAEKSHMRLLIKAIGMCGPENGRPH